MLPVVEAVSVAKAPSYANVLALDSRIRDFDVPSSLRMMDQDDDSPHPLALHQAMIACNREVGKSCTSQFSSSIASPRFSTPGPPTLTPITITDAHPINFSSARIALLQLHRNYFTQALNVSDGFTFKHKYAPSVLATFTSSCNLIWTVYTLYRWEPTASVRFTPFWSNCFSASVCVFLKTFLQTDIVQLFAPAP